VIFVHIGMSKTGSSHIQHALHANPERVAELGYEFPTIGRAGVNHHPLAIPLTRGEVPAQWAALREFMEATTRHVILTGEAFEGVEPEVLREALAGLDVRIIFYVRPAAARLPSSYSQNTKYGLSVVDFDTFFGRCDITGNAQWGPGRFTATWAKAFGGENVRVRSLDRASLEDGDLLTDFVVGIGGPRDHGLSVPTDMDAGNESPPWQLVESLRFLHERTIGPPISDVERMSDPVLWPYLQHTFEVGVRMAADVGWTDRGRYLTAAQGTWLAGLHDAEVALLDSLGVDALVAREAPFTAREFLPTIEAIPADERAAFWEAIGPRLLHWTLRRA
jgi:hypothetical protein